MQAPARVLQSAHPGVQLQLQREVGVYIHEALELEPVLSTKADLEPARHGASWNDVKPDTQPDKQPETQLRIQK